MRKIPSACWLTLFPPRRRANRVECVVLLRWLLQIPALGNVRNSASWIEPIVKNGIGSTKRKQIELHLWVDFIWWRTAVAVVCFCTILTEGYFGIQYSSNRDIRALQAKCTNIFLLFNVTCLGSPLFFIAFHFIFWINVLWIFDVVLCTPDFWFRIQYCFSDRDGKKKLYSISILLIYGRQNFLMDHSGTSWPAPCYSYFFPFCSSSCHYVSLVPSSSCTLCIHFCIAVQLHTLSKFYCRINLELNVRPYITVDGYSTGSLLVLCIAF